MGQGVIKSERRGKVRLSKGVGDSTMEPEALGRLFDRHAPALVLYARQWTATPEDVVQDAFVKLSQSRTEADQIVPWLFRVVRNAAINAGRADRNRRRREASRVVEEAWFASVDDQLDAQAATRWLAELEEDAREVIICRIWGGLTFEEIAQLQGCSVSTAHRRYQAGLSLLNARIER